MKIDKIIGIVFGTLMTILIVLMFKTYYNDRYKGTTYYAVVRSSSLIEPEDILDFEGNVADKGFSYKLRAYNTKGEVIVAEFDVTSETAKGLYQNNTYLEIEHSKMIVLSQRTISKSDVPNEILLLIEDDIDTNK